MSVDARRGMMTPMSTAVTSEAVAFLGGQWATELVDVTCDLSALDSTGRWAVAMPYDGSPVCARFDRWTTGQPGPTGVIRQGWRGPDRQAWTSSLDEAGYVDRVARIRSAIAAGDVYQANLCRVLSAPLPDPGATSVAALWRGLAAGNPAPYGGFIDLPDDGVAVASASPELFVSVRPEGSRRVARSGPIKGTGRIAADLTDKDVAENVMIVDLVRNDLSRVSVPGTVVVPELLAVEEHPGLVHLVSYVEADLLPGTTWPQLAEAAFPPGSVTGAPKCAALGLIQELETASREFYCGALGWVDADAGTAELAVAIRTFWIRDGQVRFGTGAGITWGSDPAAEWRETELKAERLVGLASTTWQGDGP